MRASPNAGRSLAYRTKAAWGRSILKKARMPAGAALSGIGLFLVYPLPDAGWLAWVALVPLLLVLLGSRPAAAFLYALLAGFISYCLMFYWLFEISGYKPLHHVLLNLYFSLFTGLFGWAVSLAARRLGPAAGLLAAPWLWIIAEFARANIPVFAAPWPLLGYSQHGWLPVIQIAALGGVYAVSLLLAMVNSALAGILLSWRGKTAGAAAGLKGRHAAAVALPAAVLAGASLVYGYIVVQRPIEGPALKIAAVQANIPQDQKWNPRYARPIMQDYQEMTESVRGRDIDLIIWPESATPHPITQVPTLFAEVFRLAQKAKTYLFLGSASHIKFNPGQKEKKLRHRNSAFLIDPRNAGNRQQYDKIVLFPFGEYLPLADKVDWSRIGVPQMGRFEPGTAFTVFNTPGFRFGATICWENGFGGLVRRMVQNGAQFIINIANEAWFGRTASPYQFLTYNVLRAVEHRRYIVRCTNTGVTCVIDPYGRIVARLRDAAGQDIFIRGVLQSEVIPSDDLTFYTRWGDWPVWIGAAFSLLLIAAALFRRRNSPAR